MARTLKTYTPEFKLAAVKMITKQKLPVAEVGRRLGISENLLHVWKQAAAKDGADAFPGSGHLTPVEDALRIRHAIDNSLKRLQLDFVDLYQIHRFDPTTPGEETLDALNRAVRAGKMLHIGASSMFSWQLAKMLNTSDKLGLAKFVTMQNHWNLVYREEEREVNPLCRDEGLGLLPWSPLARGFQGRQPQGERGRGHEPGEDGRHRAEVLLPGFGLRGSGPRFRSGGQARRAKRTGGAGRLLQQPGVTAPIIGASKPHHITDVIAALSVKLDAEEMKAMEEPYRPDPILGHS